MAWSGFVVRPFGVRQVTPKTGTPYQVDYERVQRELIDPAMQAAGIDGATTEVIVEAGNIREDMFQLLAHADIVIADISLHNANVFYELGARHALRRRRTFLIRFSGDEVPFDIKTDRYLGYDHQNPGASVAALTAGLKATLADRERVDSPIFNLLPALKAPDIKDLVPVPPDFQEELRSAQDKGLVGHLVLLGEEAAALPWGAEGLRLVGRALVALKAWESGRQAWEAVRTRRDRDLEADLKLGTVHQRLGDLPASDAAIERALTLHAAITPWDRAEALSLRGSNAKQRWMDTWGSAPAPDLARDAMLSEDFDQAADAYGAAFDADLNHFYSGINALSLTRVKLELATAWPDAWTDAHAAESESAGAIALSALTARVGNLAGAVMLSIQRSERLLPPAGDEARWARCSLAEAQLLRNDSPARVVAAFQRALQGAKPAFHDACRRQLAVYRRLGLFGAQLAALDALLDKTAPPRPPAAQAPPRILLFAGHRIDAPGRKDPRFPAAQEATARSAIRQAVEQIRASGAGDDALQGLSGGASGGDLLFHEVCAELGIPCTLYLAMPVQHYVTRSVQVPPAIDTTPGWIERFHTVRRRCEAAGQLVMLGLDDELPHWASRLADYSIWERNNRWMLQSALSHDPHRVTLLVLWDGQRGDAPGGTQHMVDVATDAGATVRVIDTRALFKLP